MVFCGLTVDDQIPGAGATESCSTSDQESSPITGLFEIVPPVANSQRGLLLFVQCKLLRHLIEFLAGKGVLRVFGLGMKFSNDAEGLVVTTLHKYCSGISLGNHVHEAETLTPSGAFR